MFIQIKEAILQFKQQYGFDDYKVDKALITAPFGQKYLEECITHLKSSKAIMRLAETEKILVLIVTSEDIKVNNCPKEFGIIQIGEITNWPYGDRYRNRFIKWAVPFLFKNIRSSIYIDSDLIITNQTKKFLRVFDIIEQYNFFVTAHVMRRGWVDEFNAILNWPDKIDFEKLQKQKILFQSLGIPKLGPVFINKIVGRIHGSKYDLLSQGILDHLFEYNTRDQLALIYAMYTHKMIPFSLPEGEILFTSHVLSLNQDTLCFYDSMSQVAFKYLWQRPFQTY